MVEEMAYIENANDRARPCTVLGKALNRIAKDMYKKTGANVAVFAPIDQGRLYQYDSPVPGVETVMDRVGYTHMMEFNLVEKLRT